MAISTSSRRVLLAFIGVGCVLAATCEPAHAAATTHMIDQVSDLFNTATAGFQDTAHGYEVAIFHIAITLEAVLVAYELCSPNSTFGDAVWGLTALLVGFGLGSYLVENTILLSNDAMKVIPDMARHFFLPGTKGALGMTPGAIGALFDDAASHLSDTIGPNPVVDIAIGLSGTIAGICLKFGGLFIAVEDAIGTVGLNFGIAIMSILLGFVGLRFTRHFASRFMGVIVNGALMLIAINCVASVGVFCAQFIQGLTDAMAADNLMGMRSDVETIAAIAFGFFAFSVALPSYTAWLGTSGMVGSATGSVMRFGSGLVGSAMSAGRMAGNAAMNSGIGSAAADSARVATISAAARTE